MTKDILTTKITKATKGSDIFAYKLRALRVLRVKSAFSFLVAAPGRDDHFGIDSHKCFF